MTNTHIYSVTELNAKVRLTLETEVSTIGVTGEISNLIKAGSGHYYFTLKDPKAQIRCAFFLNSQKSLTPILSNGQQVLAYGKISLYEPRGDYQLIVSHIQEYGIGLLYQQFIALKQKLEQQGLFSSELKKPLPKFPQTIAIVTSPKGAALQDILSTLQRRYPIAKIQLYGTEVQGTEAAKQIIKALKQVIEDKRADLIILARGGGSIEDLWAFNDELLAYTIAQCTIPIITGIGHETDFTIADFVADYRAATPTAAAEKATPNQSDLLQLIRQSEARLIHYTQQKLKHYQQTTEWFKRQLAYPEKLLIPIWQKLDYATKNLESSTNQRLFHLNQHAIQLKQRIESLNPIFQLKLKSEQLQNRQQRLVHMLRLIIEQKKQSYLSLEKHLKSLAPDATLNRGYAIVRYQDQIITDSQHVPLQGSIRVQLAKGKLLASVEEKS
jgi:exodeoxyribonuclease VII large subunit